MINSFLSSQWSLCLWKRRSHWLILPCHVTLEHHTNTFKDTKQTSTSDGGVSCVSPATSNGKGTTSEETCNDSVEWILSLSDTLHSTVKSGEQTTPDTKITTDNWSTSLNGREGAWETFTVWRVSETFDTVPDTTTNDLKKGVLVCE